MSADGSGHYDLAIVGTGSGNTILDERFADKTVAVIEEGVFGGTCLNVGCIPTKMFVYAADVARTIEHSARLGLDAHLDKVRWPEIVGRVFGRIDPISDGGRRYRSNDCPGTTVLTGHARFSGDRRLDVDLSGGGTATVTADQVVLAAGARPVIPDYVRDSGVPYHTNDDIMRLPELPRELVILGSGFVASEFAHVFSALGSQVKVIARSGALLRHLDTEISQHFTELASAAWDLHLGEPAVAVRQRTGGGVLVDLADGTVVDGDALLVAVGRRPNGDRLGGDAGGVDIRPDGRVVVDEFQRTSAAGVFALGDVSSEHQLKHVANHEARVVAHNLLAEAKGEPLRSSDHRFIPSAVFTDPQIATVGLTEEQARERGHDVTVKVQAYADVAYGWAMEDYTGRCKLVADRTTGALLGAHLIGPQASTLIQPLVQAMTFGLGAAEMAHGQYWIHPALTEVVENALLGLDL